MKINGKKVSLKSDADMQAKKMKPKRNMFSLQPLFAVVCHIQHYLSDDSK
jgi:hypothetical protein